MSYYEELKLYMFAGYYLILRISSSSTFAFVSLPRTSGMNKGSSRNYYRSILFFPYVSECVLCNLAKSSREQHIAHVQICYDSHIQMKNFDKEMEFSLFALLLPQKLYRRRKIEENFGNFTYMNIKNYRYLS